MSPSFLIPRQPFHSAKSPADSAFFTGRSSSTGICHPPQGQDLFFWGKKLWRIMDLPGKSMDSLETPFTKLQLRYTARGTPRCGDSTASWCGGVRMLLEFYTPWKNHGSGWHGPLDDRQILYKHVVNSTSMLIFLGVYGSLGINLCSPDVLNHQTDDLLFGPVSQTTNHYIFIVI